MTDRDMKQNELEQLLQDAAPDSFSPWFTEKVMHRIAAEQPKKSSLFAWLGVPFPRIALAGMLVIVMLGLFNIRAQWEYRTEQSVLEMALGLVPQSQIYQEQFYVGG